MRWFVSGLFIGAMVWASVGIAIINNEPTYDCNMVGTCHDWTVPGGPSSITGGK